MTGRTLALPTPVSPTRVAVLSTVGSLLVPCTNLALITLYAVPLPLPAAVAVNSLPTLASTAPHATQSVVPTDTITSCAPTIKSSSLTIVSSAHLNVRAPV